MCGMHCVVPVQKEGNLKILRCAGNHRQQFRIAVMCQKYVRVAAVQMPVERLQHLARIVLFQKERMVLIADFKKYILLIFRRDEIVRIAHEHNGERRQFVSSASRLSFKCHSVNSPF